MSDSNPIGRPTSYKEEYCEMLIEHMRHGYSFESFAATIDVNRDTLYEWCKVHAKFSDAKKIAKDKSLLFFEKVGIAGMTGKLKGFNVAVWIFSLKNRHSDLYSDMVNLDQDNRTVTISYEPKSRRLES